MSTDERRGCESPPPAGDPSSGRAARARRPGVRAGRRSADPPDRAPDLSRCHRDPGHARHRVRRMQDLSRQRGPSRCTRPERNQGSVGLPVGTVGLEDAEFTRPLKAHFPPSWDTYLLHCSVSDRTSIRPDRYDRRHILDVFRKQAAADRAASTECLCPGRRARLPSSDGPRSRCRPGPGDPPSVPNRDRHDLRRLAPVGPDASCRQLLTRGSDQPAAGSHQGPVAELGEGAPCL